MTLAAWVHDLGPVAFSLGPLAIRWYGLSYVMGFVIGWLLLRELSRRGLVRIPMDRVGDAIMYFVIGILVGGRLGYVLVYEPSLLVAFDGGFPFWGVLKINQGGMASHGGIVGVILASVVISRGFKNERGEVVGRCEPEHVMDVIALLAPFGLGLGRLANFVNGELLGRVVVGPGEGRDAPWWSVRFPQEVFDEHAPELTSQEAFDLSVLASRYALPGDEGFGAQYERMLSVLQAGGARGAEVARELSPFLAARHPSQLYQAAAEGLVLGGVLWWVWRKPRRVGVVGCWFLITYGVMRIVTEFWRLPDGHLAVQRVLGLSRGQWLSAVMVVVGAALMWHYARREGERLGGWMEGWKARRRTA